MNKILAIISILVITLTVFSACSKQEKPNENSEAQTTSATTTEKETTEAKTEKQSESSTSTKAFAKWDEKDFVEYFKNEGVFSNDGYISVISDEDDLPDGVNAEIDYDSHQNDEIYVMVFYLDENSGSKNTKELYEQIKKNKYYEWEGSGSQQPFNALIGRFAIFYSSSLDEKFINQFERALDKLIKEQNLTPEFYEKEIDLSKYNENEVIIINDDE